jgi:hypothetical protein
MCIYTTYTTYIYHIYTYHLYIIHIYYIYTFTYTYLVWDNVERLEICQYVGLVLLLLLGRVRVVKAHLVIERVIT